MKAKDKGFKCLKLILLSTLGRYYRLKIVKMYSISLRNNILLIGILSLLYPDLPHNSHLSSVDLELKLRKLIEKLSKKINIITMVNNLFEKLTSTLKEVKFNKEIQ